MQNTRRDLKRRAGRSLRQCNSHRGASPPEQEAWSTLNRQLLAAGEAKDVLRLLARGAWHKRHGLAKPFPEDQNPGIEPLTRWLEDCPKAAWLEAGERSQSLYKGVPYWPYLLHPARAALQGRDDLFFTGGTPGAWKIVPLGGTRESVIRSDIDSVHKTWIQQDEQSRGKHPLAPLVEAWQERPREVAPDRRRNGILPQPLASIRTVRVVGRSDSQGELPRYHRTLGLRWIGAGLAARTGAGRNKDCTGLPFGRFRLQRRALPRPGARCSSGTPRVHGSPALRPPYVARLDVTAYVFGRNRIRFWT